MSRSRDKGNRLEKLVMPLLHEADGHDPKWKPMQTSTGRIGNTYHLEVDGVTTRFLVECKNRESIGAYLWGWLAHMPDWTMKTKLLVVKRNHQKPLVVLALDDFLTLIKEKPDVRVDL